MMEVYNKSFDAVLDKIKYSSVDGVLYSSIHEIDKRYKGCDICVFIEENEKGEKMYRVARKKGINPGEYEGSMERIAKVAIDAYGRNSQINQSIEEMAELIVALNHYRRHKNNAFMVVEEIADVKIMVSQLEILFGEKDVQNQVERKLLRLQNRINAAKEVCDG